MSCLQFEYRYLRLIHLSSARLSVHGGYKHGPWLNTDSRVGGETVGETRMIETDSILHHRLQKQEGPHHQLNDELITTPNIPRGTWTIALIYILRFLPNTDEMPNPNPCLTLRMNQFTFTN